MGKAKMETWRERAARRYRAEHGEPPPKKRERTYFAMKQSESLNEWIERIRQTRAAGKRPKEFWEVGPNWDGEDDE
jgi:hypothetical protein